MWSWRLRKPSRTAQVPSSQPFRNPVTRWPRPSSWTAASERTGRQGLCRSSLPHPPYPNTPSPQQVERGERADERKRIEKERQTGDHDSPSCLGYDPPTRIRSLKEGGPAGALAHYLIGHLSYSQVPALAKRKHKVEVKKRLCVRAGVLLAKQVATYDESGTLQAASRNPACWIRRISDPPSAATTFSPHGWRQTLPCGHGEAPEGRG